MKTYKIIFVITLLSQTLFSQKPEETYRNPVIRGDMPDPTIIRVGEDYYASGTTSDFVPAYPIYHSRDLVNWERIGAIFNEMPEWISGDCWAPELFYHNHTFYVYYTAKRKGDHVSCIGVATTKDITKGFQDHGILIEWGKEAIDAYVFRDDDDKLYISWKAYGLDKSRPIEILCSELTPDGLAFTGEPFTLTDHTKGWVGRGDEGQCILKHGKYYYHFYSVGGCCDNRCDYRVHVARATGLRGEWEQYEPAPVLEGGGLWKCSGHGTFVITPDNRYFYLYHAYHAYDFEYVGRQALLDELLWDEETGWPYFRYGNTPSAQAPVPFPGTIQKETTAFYDDFISGKEELAWQWYIHLSEPVVSRKDGVLEITNEENTYCFRGINSLTGNYVVETDKLEGEGFSGLCLFGNEKNFYTWGSDERSVYLFKVQNGEKEKLYIQPCGENSRITFRIEAAAGRLFRFSWSTDGSSWNTYPDNNTWIEGSLLPQWGRGLRIGYLLDNKKGVSGRFSRFSLVPKE